MPLSTWFYILAIISAGVFGVLGRAQQAKENDTSKQSSQEKTAKIDTGITAILDARTNHEPAAKIVIADKTQAYLEASKRRKTLKSTDIDDKLNAIGDEYEAKEKKEAAQIAAVPSRILVLRKALDPIMNLAIAEANDKISELEKTGYVRKTGIVQSDDWKGVSVWKTQLIMVRSETHGKMVQGADGGGYLKIEYQMKYGTGNESFLIRPYTFTNHGSMVGITFHEGGMFGSAGKLTIEELESGENTDKVIDSIRASLDKSVENSLERMGIEKRKGTKPNW